MQSATRLDNRWAKDTLNGTLKELDMRTLALSLTLLATPINAHEFWIEPQKYQVDIEEPIVAELVNGEDFFGPKLAYLPQRFQHFALFYDGGTGKVPGRVGDTPAVQVDPIGDGLHVFAYQSKPSVVTYDNWEKFQKFVDHKDFGDVRSRHDERGLSVEIFGEVYTRYSKSLVGVGSGAGSDQRVGLETEIVALTNPYTDDLTDGMRFEVYYRNERRPNVRFEVDTNTVWETLWANMTWAVP